MVERAEWIGAHWGQGTRMGADKGAGLSRTITGGPLLRSPAVRLGRGICVADPSRPWKTPIAISADTDAFGLVRGGILSAQKPVRRRRGWYWRATCRTLRGRPSSTWPPSGTCTNWRPPTLARTMVPRTVCAIYEPKSVFRLMQFLAFGYHCPRKVLINSDTWLLELAETRVGQCEYAAERDTALGPISLLRPGQEDRSGVVLSRWREQRGLRNEWRPTRRPRANLYRTGTQHAFRWAPPRPVVVNESFSLGTQIWRWRLVAFPPVAGGSRRSVCRSMINGGTATARLRNWRGRLCHV